MMMRPVPARWFEALVARDDMTHAMDRLAETGMIQIEYRSASRNAEQFRDLQALYQEYRELKQHDGGYWPSEGIRPSDTRGRPATTYTNALNRLRTWRSEHNDVIERLERLRRDRTHYHHLLEFLQGIRSRQALDLTQLHRAGPWLDYRLFLCPPDCEVDFDHSGMLILQTPCAEGVYRLVLSDRDTLRELDTRLLQTDVLTLTVPDWLKGGPPQAIATLSRHLETLEGDLRQTQADLVESHDRSELYSALGDIYQLNWFMQQIEYQLESEQLAWVRGWTVARTETDLQQALSRYEIRGVIHFSEPPPDAEQPLTLRHPPWIKPFELFPRLLGMPALTEVDPTTLLAGMVPLLFGYMFGDLGQGLVILLAGIYLQRRLPQLRILVPAGASAMVFGILYGSVFSIENLLPPLWLHPMQHPLLVLGIPLAVGSLLLLTGLLFDALQAYWQQQSRRWWLTQAPIILMYFALFGFFIDVGLGWSLLGIGLVWYLAGHARLAPVAPLKHTAIAFAELIEVLFQLIINTLSFSRVGAFALAHAGLSQTVMALMDIAQSTLATAVIFLAGNIVILVLEGLIVSIQTTRLVLFEFFIRFMRSGGKAFQPLTAPRYREETAQ